MGRRGTRSEIKALCTYIWLQSALNPTLGHCFAPEAEENQFFYWLGSTVKRDLGLEAVAFVSLPCPPQASYPSPLSPDPVYFLYEGLE